MPVLPTQRYQQQDLLHIGDADTYLLAAPDHGGRLVRWVHRGQDILHWPDDADWTRVARVRGGNPLLFPFIARHFVAGTIGQWQDAAGIVRELPMHGFARDLPFAVTAWDAASVTMSLASSPATHAWYPFDFVFEATYRLLPDALEVTLATANTGTDALPYYAGHHFYFALPHAARGGCTLTMPAADRQRQRPDGSLEAAEAGESGYRLNDPRLQDTYHVLRGPGPVTLDIPPGTAAPEGRAIVIELEPGGSAPWYAVTTWSESETSDFYCLEPWLGLPNAIHHGQGLRWLAPGERESATCRLRLESRR